jgi:hypothetical protein
VIGFRGRSAVVAALLLALFLLGGLYLLGVMYPVLPAQEAEGIVGLVTCFSGPEVLGNETAVLVDELSAGEGDAYNNDGGPGRSFVWQMGAATLSGTVAMVRMRRYRTRMGTSWTWMLWRRGRSKKREAM